MFSWLSCELASTMTSVAWLSVWCISISKWSFCRSLLWADWWRRQGFLTSTVHVDILSKFCLQISISFPLRCWCHQALSHKVYLLLSILVSMPISKLKNISYHYRFGVCHLALFQSLSIVSLLTSFPETGWISLTILDPKLSVCLSS